MARPLVFLDIDGVLALPEDYKLPWSRPATPGGVQYPYGFSRDPVNNRLELLSRTGADVVVSSTWRMGRSEEELSMIFEDQGILGVNVVDTTPVLKDGHRGDEIWSWLKTHFDLEGRVPFVILDDDTDMGPLLPWLVWTSPLEGLTASRARAAEDILTTPLSDYCPHPRELVVPHVSRISGTHSDHCPVCDQYVIGAYDDEDFEEVQHGS